MDASSSTVDRERRRRTCRWTVMAAGRRTVWSCVVALVTVACAACGPGVSADPPSEAAGPPTTTAASPGPTPSQPRSSTDPEAALRTRLADALRPDDPAGARAVADPATQLTVLDTDWLPGWQVVDVQVRRVPHPQRFAVGLAADGRARVLSGRSENVNAMLADARIRVGPETAAALTRTFLDVTRTFQRWSYRVESVDAIEWRPNLTPAEQQSRDTVRQTYGRTVAPPRATPAGDGWTLTAWMVDGSTLVRHDLTLASDGQTTDQVTVVERELAVPDSI